MDIYLTFGMAGFCVLMSAICSGLNVSILAIPLKDIERKAKLGNRRAKRILPLKQNVHLTLASVLITNVGAVTATSLLLDTKLGGILAGIVSTFILVIFGEILPQAIFSKKALKFCSDLAWLMKLMIVLTYPVSKPLQLLLDKLFKPNKEKLQSRGELGLMITEHLKNSSSELDEDEVEIIRGALQLSEKRVRDIMTPINQVFWLKPKEVIDIKLLAKIKDQGYSRIPIFNKTLTLCEGMLLMKDLVDIDFDEKVYKVDDLPLRSTRIVGAMTALDTMFRHFINAKTHLMPVERDDKIVGIVTIEDLIEEIIGHEIEDETDKSDEENLLY